MALDKKALAKHFENSRSGVYPFKVLKRDVKGYAGKVVGQVALDDIDYYELLGRKVLEMEKNNPNKQIPVNLKQYDKTTVDFCKEICKGIDAGMSKEDLLKYANNCIKIDE